MRTIAVFLVSVVLFSVSSFIIERSWGPAIDTSDRQVSESDDRTILPPPPQLDLTFSFLISTAVSCLPWGCYLVARRRNRGAWLGFAVFMVVVFVLAVAPALAPIFALYQLVKQVLAVFLGCVAGLVIGSRFHREERYAQLRGAV